MAKAKRLGRGLTLLLIAPSRTCHLHPHELRSHALRCCSAMQHRHAMYMRQACNLPCTMATPRLGRPSKAAQQRRNGKSRGPAQPSHMQPQEGKLTWRLAMCKAMPGVVQWQQLVHVSAPACAQYLSSPHGACCALLCSSKHARKQDDALCVRPKGRCAKRVTQMTTGASSFAA